MLDVCRWGHRRRGFDSFEDCAGRLALQTGPVFVAGRSMGFGEADPCQRRLVRGADFVPESQRF